MENQGTELNSTELAPGARPIESFEKIVKESSDALQAEAAAQIKRGRGRPKGSTQKKAPPDSSVSPEAAQDAPTASLQAQMNEIKPLVREAIKTPFSIIAEKYRNEKIEVTDDEAEVPSQYLAKYLGHVFPEIEKKGPKEFNLYAFLISGLMLLLKKAKFMRQTVVNRTAPVEIITSEPSTAPNSSPPPAPNGGMSSGSYFSGRH